jgi:hypothetical protein
MSTARDKEVHGVAGPCEFPRHLVHELDIADGLQISASAAFRPAPGHPPSFHSDHDFPQEASAS